MTFPDSMLTAVLKVGAPLPFLGTPIRTVVHVTPSDYVTWEPTGEAFIPLTELARNLTAYEIEIPCVDQVGFVDSAGAAIQNFYFTVKVTYMGGGQEWSVTKTVQPLSDQTELDFDLIPFDNPEAPILGNVGFVTSVNGLTGAVDVEQLAGYAGPQGETGPQGIQGIQGPQGLPGIDGVDGAEGPEGMQGVPGIQGIPGTNGTNGAAGATGATGASAYAAAVAGGFVGTQAAWIASLQGAQGIQGIQGVPGNDGADGAPGADGDQGIQGIQGVPGVDGADGADGATGPAGDPATNLLWPVRRVAGVWPARPTASSTTTVVWIGADPSPAIVSSGTGGMLDNIDVRWVT